ncbi:hypothetical protein RQP46_003333 [Phenoliferia psychrophenolica]
MTALSIASTVTLGSGSQIPRLGFGVFMSTDAYASTSVALKAGYLHVDTARWYKNEGTTLTAVRAWKDAGGKGDVFLTSKVMSMEHGTKEATAAVADSIKTAAGEGLKWSERHLAEFKKSGLKEKIAVNQIELHPWCQQKPIVDYCKAQGIVVEAYCPLLRGQKFGDPTLKAVAERVGKTEAQVLIRWSLQSGFVPLVKSDTPSRIESNAGVFGWELDTEAMKTLNGLDQGDAGSMSWNPIKVE